TLEVSDGRTILSVLEGTVEMSHAFDRIELKAGEQGIVETGQRLRKTAFLEPINIIQWCLYYPAVLDTEELRLSVEERGALSQSLAAYERGDLVAAFGAYPADRQPAS